MTKAEKLNKKNLSENVKQEKVSSSKTKEKENKTAEIQQVVTNPTEMIKKISTVKLIAIFNGNRAIRNVFNNKLIGFNYYLFNFIPKEEFDLLSNNEKGNILSFKFNRVLGNLSYNWGYLLGHKGELAVRTSVPLKLNDPTVLNNKFNEISDNCDIVSGNQIYKFFASLEENDFIEIEAFFVDKIEHKYPWERNFLYVFYKVYVHFCAFLFAKVVFFL